MIAIREARVWTVLLVAGLCLVAISAAWPTVRFGLAEQIADPRAAQARLQPLISEPPVGALAQQAALDLALPAPASERRAALQRLLEATPLASGAWLDLAAERERSGLPMRQVASALALSSLTGPNEARIMAGRAAFGLRLWGQLPPDLRRGLIGDLVGGWGDVDDARREELGAVLALAPDQARSEILSALLLAGPPGAPIIAALDLAPKTEPKTDKAAGQDAAPGGDGGDKTLTAPAAPAPVLSAPASSSAAPQAGGGNDKP
jgi:hypothetical protein